MQLEQRYYRKAPCRESFLITKGDLNGAEYGRISTTMYAEYLYMLDKIAPELRRVITKKTIFPTDPATLWWHRQTGMPTTVRPDVQCHRHTTATNVVWYEYLARSQTQQANLPVLLWIHGGGLIMGTAAQDHYWCSILAHVLQMRVVSVEYRLAPEHPFPAAHDDCFAVLELLAAENPPALVVAGSSAGGGLAATVVQHAVDAGIIITGQVLVYPMLDPQPTKNQFGVEFSPLWPASAHEYAWKSYLRGLDRTALPAYAAASTYRDFQDLPPTWIGIGDLDLFYVQAREYAAQLPDCTWYEVPGMYHAADMIVPEAISMRAFHLAMLTWIHRLCADSTLT